MKNLFRKFSYPQLDTLCKEKNWIIPSVAYIRTNDDYIEHDWIYVNNEVIEDNEDGTRAMIYNKVLDKTEIINMNFMQNCSVIKLTKK